MSTQHTMHEVVPIAFEELAERCLGRLDFVQRVLTSFTCRFQEDLEQLEKELSRGNTSEVARRAHRMKGACGNTAAHQLRETMAQIEQLAREDRLDDIPSRFDRLQEEFDKFLHSTESFASSGGMDFTT